METDILKYMEMLELQTITRCQINTGSTLSKLELDMNIGLMTYFESYEAKDCVNIHGRVYHRNI